MVVDSSTVAYRGIYYPMETSHLANSCYIISNAIDTIYKLINITGNGRLKLLTASFILRSNETTINFEYQRFTTTPRKIVGCKNLRKYRCLKQSHKTNYFEIFAYN